MRSNLPWRLWLRHNDCAMLNGLTDVAWQNSRKGTQQPADQQVPTVNEHEEQYLER
jgi:hypothetical protein